MSDDSNPAPAWQVFLTQAFAPRLILFYPALLLAWAADHALPGWVAAAVQWLGVGAAFVGTAVLTDQRLTRRLPGRALLDPAPIERLVRRILNPPTVAPGSFWGNLIPIATLAGMVWILDCLYLRPLWTFFWGDLVFWTVLILARRGYETFLSVVYAEYLAEERPQRLEQLQKSKDKQALDGRSGERNRVQEQYDRNAAVLREELPPAEFRKELDLAIPADALPGEAEEGAAELLELMKPMLARGRKRQKRLRERLKSIDTEIAKRKAEQNAEQRAGPSKRHSANRQKINELNEERQTILTLLSPTGVAP